MSSLGIFNKETKTYQKIAGTAEAAVLDAAMSDTSTNPVQNKVIKKYVDEKQVNIDGVTLTLDEAKNVIKLADELKDKIGSALQPESIVNNHTTTVEGYALDAIQANPNVSKTLANNIKMLNPSSGIKIFNWPAYNLGEKGEGWYRVARIIFQTNMYSQGYWTPYMEIMLCESNTDGCFHKVEAIIQMKNKGRISSFGYGITHLKKVRIVTDGNSGNSLYLDVYHTNKPKAVQILLNIPFAKGIGVISTSTFEKNIKIVPETTNGEVIACSIDLEDNFPKLATS